MRSPCRIGLLVLSLAASTTFGQQDAAVTSPRANALCLYVGQIDCKPESASFKKTRLNSKASVASLDDATDHSRPAGLTSRRRYFDDTDAASGGNAQTPPEDPQALAKKLSNPVASLISFPFQNNFDFGMGPGGDGFRYTLNIQPVIPITLNKEWNLISRTILPVIGQKDVVSKGSNQFGLGDTIQSFFFSPSKVDPFIWGVGPQILIPTATSNYLGSRKLGLGPTFVILKQRGPWTVGALINHTWSVAGSSTRPKVNLTFLQPFLGYTTKSAWTFTLNTESAYDWRTHVWAVPIHFQITKLVRFGKQPVSIGGALRCWASSGAGGPQNCGFRLIFTPLFPKK